MTVWITGARGFIARHLVRELVARGLVVDGIGHGAIDGDEKKYLGYRGCLNGEVSASNLHSLATSYGPPKIIYHLAGGSSVGLSILQPHEDFARTVLGAEQLLEWMRVNAPECRLVSVSSAAVYGAIHQGPIAEGVALNPMSPYGQHKLMMEQLCKSYADTFGLRVITVRLFSVYGPMLRKQLLWDLCNRLQNGERQIKLGGTGHEMRDWTHVEDVARLLAGLPMLASWDSYRVLNGGSGTGTSVAAIAGLIAKRWSEDASIAFSGQVRAGDPTSLVSDSTQLKATGFDWTIKLDAGVSDYVDWFKAQII